MPLDTRRGQRGRVVDSLKKAGGKLPTWQGTSRPGAITVLASQEWRIPTVATRIHLLSSWWLGTNARQPHELLSDEPTLDEDPRLEDAVRRKAGSEARKHFAPANATIPKSSAAEHVGAHLTPCQPHGLRVRIRTLAATSNRSLPQVCCRNRKKGIVL